MSTLGGAALQEGSKRRPGVLGQTVLGKICMLLDVNLGSIVKGVQSPSKRLIECEGNQRVTERNRRSPILYFYSCFWTGESSLLR